ncbi:hypothetical protein ACEN9J_01240 [Variovorax sp. Varisp41]
MRTTTPSNRPVPHRRPLASLAGLAVSTVMFMLLAGCTKNESESATSAQDTAAAEAMPAATDPAPPATPRPEFSATLQRDALMALLFEPPPAGETASRTDSVQLPEIGNDGKPMTEGFSPTRAQVSAREVVRLDDTHAVLLTETVPVDDRGQPMDAHVAGAWLGAYFFEHGDAGWKLAGRNDGVDYLGFSGNIGLTRVERIAPQRFVLTVTSGSCWQGYCGSWLSVYEIGAAEVRQLIEGVPLGADNGGADGACESVLQATRPEEAPRGACFRIDGKPEFALGTQDDPGELQIVFKGARTRDANDLRVQTVDEQLVYSLRNGAYALVQGRNPVPSF